MNQGSNERGRGRKEELAVVFIEDQGKKRKKIKKENIYGEEYPAGRNGDTS